MNAPCYNCEDHKVGCHGKCEKYAEYKVKREEVYRKRRELTEAWFDYKGYQKAKHKRLGGKDE